ncbi:MAG TPA: aldehyde ferredoxin oxidoreductase family protein [Deltaproteobacteria bacterium]|nr:aldehyde ferredoxin oxidoreductase family protein [Deltaproteobacteria bacterium]HPR53244.1 aldehyde ferredoxin oxidoreductase family protein [Deltaproteobacteria bacterium]
MNTKAYAGKGLRIDLSAQRVTTEPLTDQMMREYIGGYLLGMKILWDEYRPEYGAFDPRNPLIFCTGPLTGTRTPTANSLTCHTKSPIADTFVSGRAGGHFGPMLKFAGYDYIVITGRAARPVWIWIDDGKVEIRDARTLWGMKTSEADAAIKGIVGSDEVETLTIGPAGEKLVRFATANCNIDRAFGRGGPGAVMGSKNLKGIAVRGSRNIEIADVKRFNAAVKKNFKELEERDAWSWEMQPKVGTAGWMEAINYYSMLPINNYQKTYDDKIAGGIDHNAYLKNFEYRKYACGNCALSCAHYIPTIKKGKYAGFSSGTLEYETAAGLGARCGVGDILAVAQANAICAEYGIDTISCGSTIAWAMECFERGLITKKDTGGIDLTFGNAEAMVRMTELIGEKEGFGVILAEGSSRASSIIGKGSEKYAMVVKSLEMSGTSPRGSKCGALMFAINERGGHHMDPYAPTIEAYGYVIAEAGIPEALNPYEDGKTGDVYKLKNYTKLADILGTCAFAVINLQTLPDTYGEQFSAATGIELKGTDLLKYSEKLTTLMRAFNAREGLTAKDDTLPDRFTKEEVEVRVPAELQKWTNGKTSIMRKIDLQKNLKDYYAAAGYDMQTGLPSYRKFEELGLAKVADELKAKGIKLV